ncbi:L-threonylcarbamoyladenylate synthase [Natranaerobius thermophilus]|uniref:Threonylcarbamoyl-AMP synthase n=1 Tax=Natranaerobius thermophilus (strain ATCC BAA-1301 / DSM 18059 / JW/NM-WN-LF) TaxID=457570 RepID=B2A3I0_NATTJ|nr:L-threonylcarbamoyladenylate synthase [Natranaerobius thermophilus]ACB86409.1 Sua5/YciO/YrdC/YwlC family protein [Natranaerobius thermophilus JW/NM-WN-LF]
MTKFEKVDKIKPDKTIIKQAAGIVRQNGLVAFPTETVYGLGGNGLSPAAIQKIFQAKNRPLDNPVILHLHSVNQVETLGFPPEEFFFLAEKFWPGPLTMIIPKKNIVPREASGGLDTVAVRMPDHNVALALIQEAQVPMAAPSANLSGRPSPTTAAHVELDLSGRIDMIIDGGTTGVGLESTVIDLSEKPYQVLRPGGITAEQLASALDYCQDTFLYTGSEEDYYAEGNQSSCDEMITKDKNSIKSPGVKYRHYSPQGELYLVEGSGHKLLHKMYEYANDFSKQGYRIGILLTNELLEEDGNLHKFCYVRRLGNEDQLTEVAHSLYDALREMDQQGIEIILCRTFSPKGIGVALMNRLLKASNGKVL